MKLLAVILGTVLLYGACTDQPQKSKREIKTITPITVDGMPSLGPYSQAVEANGFVFLSGIVAYDAKAGAFASADIQTQTKQVFANLKQVLAASGLGLDDVVKTTVFLKNPEDFAPMNKIYAEYFTTHKPARSTVPGVNWGRDDVLIEIEAVALKR